MKFLQSSHLCIIIIINIIGASVIGCKDPECNVSADCDDGAMCVNGDCKETTANTSTDDPPITVGPGSVEPNDSDDVDNDTNKNSDTDTNAEIIFLYSDTEINADTQLGCRQDTIEFGVCSYDHDYSYNTATQICDVLYIGGCLVLEECIGKCEIIYTDTDVNELQTYTEFYYSVEGASESALQSYCFASNGEWQTCDY